MNKVYGQKSGYSPIRFDRTRYIVSYGMEAVDETHATWYEVYYYKKQIPAPSLEMIKNDIISEINTQITDNITSGFTWNDKPVWLSIENQIDFSEAQKVTQLQNGANLPLTLKLGEDEYGESVYHTFTTVESLNQFYLDYTSYINECLSKGRNEKDSINWNDYVIPNE